MDASLLVSVGCDGNTQTILFDTKVQSVLWIKPAAAGDSQTVWARLQAQDGDVVLHPASGVSLVLGRSSAAVRGPLAIGSCLPAFVIVRADDGRTCGVLVRAVPAGYGTYAKIAFETDVSFVVGRDAACEVRYANELVSGRHARITRSGTSFVLEDLGSANGTLVNGRMVKAHQPRMLAAGDVVQVGDLTLMAGRSFLLANTPAGVRFGSVCGRCPATRRLTRVAKKAARSVVDEQPLFYPAPRLCRTTHPLELVVEAPPPRPRGEEQPLLTRMGPSLFMGMTSALMAASSVSRIMGGANVWEMAPSLCMALGMVGGSIVWPLVARRYENKELRAKEMRRQSMYVAYLDSLENQLMEEAHAQRLVLEERRQPLGDLLRAAEELKPTLMSHAPTHEDFLDLRVGIGDASLAASISWPKHQLSLEPDPMLERADELARKVPVLANVPVAFNPGRDYVAGVVGERPLVWEFVRGLWVQVCAMYSYRDVRVALVVSKDERAEWSALSVLGHTCDDVSGRRLVAASPAGMCELDRVLEAELKVRGREHGRSLADLAPYYLVICANTNLAKRSGVLRRLGCLRSNKGFSLLYMGNRLEDLPRECDYIVDLTPSKEPSVGAKALQDEAERRQDGRSARMFARSDVQGTLAFFEPDMFVSGEAARAFALNLARVRLDADDRRLACPTSVELLELYEVGNVAHLDIGRRWAKNDASRSLQVPVGMDDQGQLAFVDLHEGVHGPHALVAGTTGSGKSEFIITMILSLCVNYAPDEVSFLLIDYKGGGLAGAFCNGRHRLAHLCGTITNLDGGAIRRSLAALRAELRRRQRVFARACELTGEATMDIYKYLSFYRQGMLVDPLPHLFVVADEFAELKQQEGEFMEELVSAARIGRSLGIHLVLATQKPTGVVDDQIWSNARLKVSLKVSDAADSREMIRTDDAASIERAGQYWMLVGYDEWYGGGQAAYAGAAYVPTERFEPRVDTSVELVDVEGNQLAVMRPLSRVATQAVSQANAVLDEVQRVARMLGKRARDLWLPPLPDRISLFELERDYGRPQDGALVCALGVLDDPHNQRQTRHDFDLTQVGNAILYGSQSSDVEGMLRAMALDMMCRYGPDHLWLYAIDFGSGSLASLEPLPHVGGVVASADDEGLTNLLHLLGLELERRRTSLSSGGGNACPSIAWGQDEEPHVVLCVTNLAALVEAHPDVEDELVRIARDGTRYGVHLLLTANSAGACRMRLRSCFGLEVPTMLNDPGDYLSILGGLGGMVVPKGQRRGIVAVEHTLYEFVGVSIAEELEQEGEAIDRVAHDARARSRAHAPSIPRLPERVQASHMVVQGQSAGFPVGYSKADVAPVSLALDLSPYVLVLGNDPAAIGRYLRGTLQALRLRADVSFAFVDWQRLLCDVDEPQVYVSEDAVSQLLESLCERAVELDIVVFVDIMRLMDCLEPTLAARLRAYLADDTGTLSTTVVLSSEAWRVRSVFEDWYKAACAYENGVWVGGGFAEQTTFGIARMLPEYRLPPKRSDGFMVHNGVVEAVRLVEGEE